MAIISMELVVKTWIGQSLNNKAVVVAMVKTVSLSQWESEFNISHHCTHCYRRGSY
jgi:hypothetical protein